ncbi:MAG: RnfABCDGE type electron transport complex subunit D [Elusimicrobiota bacterium]|nr:RnfABCDGE type electron transport complex subunit D [Elusimicrobiota bacterium]
MSMEKKLKEKLKLGIKSAPHIKESMDMDKMMKYTVLALLFPVAGSIYLFGLKALYLILSCTLTAAAADKIFRLIRGEKTPDKSSVITGILMALILPPSFPVWAALLGVLFAIIIVKNIFGGLGNNIFNPALMGRAFLAATFPVLITTYVLIPRQIPLTDTVSYSAETSATAAVTGATPLSKYRFEDKSYDAGSIPYLLLGRHKGSTGETFGLMILLGLAVLLLTGAADWRLPFSYFGSAFILFLIFWLIEPAKYLNPFTALFMGGILLGGTYMVTDPVTTPVTPFGKWIFGIGAAALTVVIRYFSGYPEGVMFSILLMNALTPLINRYTRPRIYGA